MRARLSLGFHLRHFEEIGEEFELRIFRHSGEFCRHLRDILARIGGCGAPFGFLRRLSAFFILRMGHGLKKRL